MEFKEVLDAASQNVSTIGMELASVKEDASVFARNINMCWLRFAPPHRFPLRL